MEHVTGKNIASALHAQVSKKARLMTDELNVYTEPGKDFASHETVAHGQGEYVRGEAHTNTAEGYFSQLKRSIDGPITMYPPFTCIATWESLITTTTPARLKIGIGQ